MLTDRQTEKHLQILSSYRSWKFDLWLDHGYKLWYIQISTYQESQDSHFWQSCIIHAFHLCIRFGTALISCLHMGVWRENEYSMMLLYVNLTYLYACKFILCNNVRKGFIIVLIRCKNIPTSLTSVFRLLWHLLYENIPLLPPGAGDISVTRCITWTDRSGTISYYSDTFYMNFSSANIFIIAEQTTESAAGMSYGSS